MHTHRLHLAACCLLAAGCATNPPFVGTFAGATVVGKGRLELRADRSFSLDLEFAYDAIRWQVTGKWRLSEKPETGFVELAVEESRLTPPTDLGNGPTDHLEPGTVLATMVRDDSAFFLGNELLELHRLR